MDPQMVWDMMDECDMEVETRSTASHSNEPEDDCKTQSTASRPSATVGWMGFPMFGMGR